MDLNKPANKIQKGLLVTIITIIFSIILNHYNISVNPLIDWILDNSIILSISVFFIYSIHVSFSFFKELDDSSRGD